MTTFDDIRIFRSIEDTFDCPSPSVSNLARSRRILVSEVPDYDESWLSRTVRAEPLSFEFLL